MPHILSVISIVIISKVVIRKVVIRKVIISIVVVSQGDNFFNIFWDFLANVIKLLKRNLQMGQID